MISWRVKGKKKNEEKNEEPSVDLSIEVYEDLVDPQALSA